MDLLLNPVNLRKVIMTKESAKKAAVFLLTICNLLSKNVKLFVYTKYKKQSGKKKKIC